MRALALALVTALALSWAAPARADEDEERWRAQYDAARRDLVEGRFRQAELTFRALALEARAERDRALALDMARLAAEYLGVRPGDVPPPPAAQDVRGSDELTLLYTSAFLYGAGTGTWFLLETQPDSALTATLPFTALTAAPVVLVATVDGYRKLPRGVPHAISAGLYLGLVESVWVAGFQHARARRIGEADPDSTIRWSPETTVGVLWGGATAGAIVGGALGSSLVTTPGRVSFTASTTIWSGVLFGLASGALLPDDSKRQERAFAAGGLGINAGIAAGLALAGTVSPSVARVRLVDLSGLAGALATTGIYLSASRDVDVRLAEGLAALGAGAGLAAGWIVTAPMKREEPPARPTQHLELQPLLRPLAGGATIGIGGAL